MNSLSLVKEHVSCFTLGLSPSGLLRTFSVMCFLLSIYVSKWNCWMGISLVSLENYRWFYKGVLPPAHESYCCSTSSLALVIIVFKIFCQPRGVGWGVKRNLFVVLFGFTSSLTFCTSGNTQHSGLLLFLLWFIVLLSREGRPLLIQPALG